MVWNSPIHFSACLLIAGTFCACGSDDAPERGAEGFSERRSSLCTDTSGAEALAWDVYNGVLVADPGLPPPLPVGGTYGNPAFPLLGFSFPAGWTPFENNSTTTIGVDLVRDDERAAWRYLFATVNGAASASAVLGAELESLAAFNESVVGTTQFRCTNEGGSQPAIGIAAEFSNALVEMNDSVALVTTSVTRVEGLPTSQVFIRAMTAPSAEFDERAYDTFLAIDWQFLVGESSNLTDRDGDGWLDGVDEFPDDPSRH